jgi:N-succinyldiaminopimelate aminotransferase
MREHAHRLTGVGSTIFAEMSALAARTGSVNLGQGFPDEDGPAEVVEAAVAAMRGGRNQYPPGHGTPELLEAVVAHQRRHYGLELDRTQVVATTGATEAIAAALLGLVDPGDEVVVLEPYYDSYVAMIQFAGAVRRPVTLRAPDFRLDADELAAAVTDRTRLILLNTPHNPTGTVLSRAELQAVAAVAIEHDLVAAVEGAKNWLSFASGAPLQPAIAVALNDHDTFHEQLAKDLREKRDRLCAGLAEVGMRVFEPAGTYFVTTDVSAYGHADGRAFCTALPELAGVVAIPSQVFYDDADEGRHLVRWAFCKRPDVIDEGVRRLAAADLHAG